MNLLYIFVGLAFFAVIKIEGLDNGTTTEPLSSSAGSNNGTSTIVLTTKSTEIAISPTPVSKTTNPTKALPSENDTSSSLSSSQSSLLLQDLTTNSSVLNVTTSIPPTTLAPEDSNSSSISPSDTNATSIPEMSSMSQIVNISSSFAAVTSATSSSAPSSLKTSISSVTPSDTMTSSQTITPSPVPSQPSPSATPSVTPPTTNPPVHTVKISETNMLLVDDATKLFVELSGTANESMDGLFLTIRNATAKAEVIGTPHSLSGSLDAQGIHVVDMSSHKMDLSLSSVVVALYSDKAKSQLVTKESLIDSLLISTHPDLVDPKVEETYHPVPGNNIYVQKAVLDMTQAISISFCAGNYTSGFVLTSESRNKVNLCTLSAVRPFEMKLTIDVGNKKCPSSLLPAKFSDTLAKEIVSSVNGNRQCGLTLSNIYRMQSKKDCKGHNEVIAVTFNFKCALEKQIECIKIGYESFVSNNTSVELLNQQYLVANCSYHCFTTVLPSSDESGSNMKVTVGVVISCIGIFLVILLIVIVYLKRKRRGILQFRMTRLDEDDDDLVGDMDDFVGNQRATFSNFR